MSLLVYNPNAGGGAPPVADTTLKRLVLTPDSLTGSAATSALSITQTLNTTGSPDVLLVDITNTASGANTTLANFKVGGVSQFKLNRKGGITIPYVSLERPFICGSGSMGLSLLLRDGHNAVFERGDSTPMCIMRHNGGGEFSAGKRLLLASDGNPYNANAFLSAAAAATWQFGENHATAPVAQTIQGAGATSGNNNGGDLTVRGGAGSGSGARGRVVLDSNTRVDGDGFDNYEIFRALFGHGLAKPPLNDFSTWGVASSNSLEIILSSRNSALVRWIIQFQISTDGSTWTNAETGLESGDGSTPTTTITGLTEATTYYIRWRSEAQGNNLVFSDWSAPQSNTTDP